MARNQVITCDAQNCGKDITEGVGVGYHLMVQGVHVPVRAGTEVIDVLAHPTLGNLDISAHDAHDVILQHHFCSFACMEGWAAHQQDERYAAQEAHKQKLVDRAQLLADEIKAMPEHLRPGYVPPEKGEAEAQS